MSEVLGFAVYPPLFNYWVTKKIDLIYLMNDVIWLHALFFYCREDKTMS
jgi:hypothetical protein